MKGNRAIPLSVLDLFTKVSNMIDKSNGFDLNFRLSIPGVRKVAFIFFALLLLILVIYGNSFDGSWIFDDEPNIIQNKYVHLKTLAWGNIQKTFYGFDQNKITRPVAYFTFGLNYYFGRLNPFSYHAVNFLIHFCSAIFLFLFVYRTLNLPRLKDDYGSSSYPVALLAAVFWAVNPVQVTAVTYIVQRMASMAGMFYIMSLYFYLMGRTGERPLRATLFFLLSAVSALLAVGSKENAVMLPVSIYLFDLLLIQGINRENLYRSLKYIILPVFVALVFIALSMNISSIAGNYSIRPFSMWERLLTEPRVIIFYITLLLYPTYSRLMLNHDFIISSSMLEPWTTIPAILLILFCLALAVAIARRKPLISYCIIFFFLNHIIEGSFISLDIVYEHRNYIPSMLFFVPLSLFIVNILDFFSYRKALQFMITLLIGFLIAAQGHTVIMYNFIFKDPYILWSDNIEKTPNLSRPHNNLGDILWARGLYDSAYESYKKSYQLNRFSVLTMVAAPISNMGSYYYHHKNYNEALNHFEEALKIKPGYPPTWMNIARTQIRMDDLKGAEETIQKALLKWPANAELYSILSFIRLKQGEFDDALKKGLKTLSIDDRFIDVKRVMAEAYRRKGFYERSVYCLEQYTASYRNDLEGHLALIDLYSKTGQKEKLDRAIAIVMVLKGSKSWNDLIDEYNSEIAVHAYVPRRDAFLAIVRKNLLKDF